MTCKVGMTCQNIHYKPIKSVGMFLILYLFSCEKAIHIAHLDAFRSKSHRNWHPKDVFSIYCKQ